MIKNDTLLCVVSLTANGPGSTNSPWLGPENLAAVGLIPSDMSPFNRYLLMSGSDACSCHDPKYQQTLGVQLLCALVFTALRAADHMSPL